MNNIRSILIICFTAGLLSACKNGVLVDSFSSVSEKGWIHSQTPEFTFEIEDTLHYTNVFLNLRITGDYPFSNLYVVAHLLIPDSSVQSQKTNLVLARDDGKWLGKGMGDVITYNLPLMQNRALKKPGKYTIRLEQYMRVDTLPGIKDVGIKVTKGEEIF